MTKDRAMALIVEALEDAGRCVRREYHHSVYGEGIAFGTCCTVYYHVLTEKQRATVIGKPTEWFEWLEQGLKEIEANVKARLAS